MAIYNIDNVPPHLNPGDIINCPYSGTIKNITLPAGGYKFECWGARGGNARVTYTASGGNGGYSYGKILLDTSTTFYLCCGGAGQDVSLSTSEYTYAYNGGGMGGETYESLVNSRGAGGGGATHISKITGELSTLSSHKSDILMVAGGGGGGYTRGLLSNRNGGSGGGKSGEDGEGVSPGQGGTQTHAGRRGGFGYGGTQSEDDTAKGAGGGGLYGGGCGGNPLIGFTDSSGGGGSGYIDDSLLEADTNIEEISTNPDTTNYAGYIRITVAYYFTAITNSPLITANVSSPIGANGDIITFSAELTSEIDWNGWYLGDTLISSDIIYSMIVNNTGVDLIAKGEHSITYSIFFEEIPDKAILAELPLTSEYMEPPESRISSVFDGWYYNADTYFNIVPISSMFIANNVYISNDIFTYKNGEGVTALTGCSLPKPEPGHKYYGRVEQRIPPNTIMTDDGFEYYCADIPDTGVINFVHFSDSPYDGEWHLASGIQSFTGLYSETNWVCRSFTTDSTNEVERRNHMIIDLTESFGLGNEPTKEWCDANIPFFIGIKPFDNFANPVEVGQYLTRNSVFWGKWLMMEKYTITYNTPYSYVPDKIIYQGEIITSEYIPSNLIADDYIFQGWYYDEELTRRVMLGETINSDCTFYAKWLKINVPIKPNLNQLTKQSYRNIDIKVFVLNYNFEVIDEISGIVESASFNIDADSDIRRTANITMLLQSNYTNTGILNNVYFQSGNGYWFDKYLNIQIGIKDNYSNEYGWYKEGIYLINEPSISYDAITNSLSFQAVDLMSKMTGERNGQLEGQTYSILVCDADGTPTNNTITKSIESLLDLQNFNKRVIFTPDINIVPQDINISAGGTTYELLSQLRDINSNWEMFFDVNGVFYFQEIPTGKAKTLDGDIVYNAHPPVVVDDNMWDQLLISYELATDFKNVKNYVEVYGRNYDVNNMLKGIDVNILNNTITCNISDIEQLDDGKYYDIIIELGNMNAQPYKLEQSIYNIIISNWELTIPCKPHIKYGNTSYLIRVSKQNEEWVLEYLGYLQPQAVAWENNPESPFYVGDVVNVYPEEYKEFDDEGNQMNYHIDDLVSYGTPAQPYICIQNYPTTPEHGTILPTNTNYWRLYTNLNPIFERWRPIQSGSTDILQYHIDDIVYYNQALWICIKDTPINQPIIPNEKYEEYWIKLNSIDAIYGQMPIFKKMVRGVCVGGDYDNQPTNQTVLELSAYELYNKCRLHDTITITCVPIYSLDVNKLISITLPNEDTPSYWIIKNISTEFEANGTQSITAMRYYPDYPIFGKRYNQM